jgi:hypothetical protein
MIKARYNSIGEVMHAVKYETRREVRRARKISSFVTIIRESFVDLKHLQAFIETI